MAYADQEMSGNKIIAIAIVALIHLLVGYALVTGLAYSAVKNVVERVTTVDIDEPEPEPVEEPPPPPEPEAAPPPPVAPPPPINIAVAPPKIQTQATIPPRAPIAVAIPPAPRAPVAPPPPPPPPSKARSASEQNARRWETRIIENYPARAIRQEIQGSVSVRLVIDAEGKVSGCTVTNSSGADILDEAACKDMQRYARYNPALDRDGNPTTGSATKTIRYVLQ